MFRRVLFSDSFLTDFINDFVLYQDSFDDKQLVKTTKSLMDSYNILIPKKEDNGYKYQVDLPGVKKEDIDIKLDKKYCTITAIRKVDKETYNINKYFSLPKYVDKNEVSAKMEDGVLTILLKEKIPEEEKPIEVKLE
jgi:HSP20 family molecular chaperone IbpA